ncbi:amino acid permease-domain-containing protein [Podospora didyma]|uniref:Amino acid permease-domain-containing protein n=1 Tax=Podospora didyma TaxID=330526 RepID=A0AAE0NGQ6_9PEZI|nr:amino acid permease-domain-containing protein [Podospora didyma]
MATYQEHLARNAHATANGGWNPNPAGGHLVPGGYAHHQQPAAPPFQSDLLDELNRTTNQGAIVTDAPDERFRLGFFDSTCLVLNRVIGTVFTCFPLCSPQGFHVCLLTSNPGTGIFNSPGAVMQGTHSAGGALLLWFFGIFYGLTGTHVYIEYGLNVPRYVIEGIEQAVPRSGGDLHYLQFVYRWIYYKKDTVLLSGVLFGISFICIGNMASNCISFAVRVLQAAHPNDEPSNGQVRGIALAAAALACVIHAVSRRGGIWLNNILALVKVGILLVIIATTLAVVGNGIHDKDGNLVQSVFMDNLNPKVAFKAPLAPVGATQAQEGTVNGYAAALLSIIFAYSGFDQTNYVLGEIATPRKTFPRATTFAMVVISVLYMVVNICYMVVVPAYEQSGHVVALLFFQRTFGFAGEGTADRIFNAFLALSSFGNIIVMTYTAARMKQEIAKQGFIPFPKFFGQNVDLSIGRFILYLRKKGWKLRSLSPEHHQEATPVGALVLHLLSCVVLIFATYNINADDAYDLLAGLIAYLTTALFGFFLALGILILRIWGPPATEPAKTKIYRSAHAGGLADDLPVRKTWSEMTGKSVYAWLSILCAIIYLVGNAFPLIASWIPATANISTSTVSWWVVPAVSWATLGFATLWWFGFLAGAKYRERHQQKNLVYEIRPEFEWAEPATEADSADDDDASMGPRRQRHGGKVLVHETVLFRWEGDENDMFGPMPSGPMGAFESVPLSTAQQQQHQQQHQQQRHGPPPPRANEDFDGFGPMPPPPQNMPQGYAQW